MVIVEEVRGEVAHLLHNLKNPDKSKIKETFAVLLATRRVISA
jgi:hypothetical protein